MPIALTPSSFGDLLLGLYNAARTPSVELFQESALGLIARVIPFDASIWGIGTVGAGNTVIAAAHLSEFSDDAVELLNREDSRNIVGKALRERPGKTHLFSSRELFPDPETEFIWDELGGVREVLCHGTIAARSGLMSFFALARRSSDHPFTKQEAEWIDLLAPHLEAMLHFCRVSELQQGTSRPRASQARSAVSDARGILHVAEPGFTDLLLEGWPDWKGPILPGEILELEPREEGNDIQRGGVSVSVSGGAQQLIVTVTRMPAMSLLTRQERAVAEAFARGRSYKEVARDLDRSPATVRHHLRSIYAKLGVSDKGALARAIFGSDWR